MCSKSVDAGWSSLVARRAHNPKVVGSIPASRYESHQMCVQITPSGFIRSSRLKVRRGDPGSLTEWLKVPDCKSVVVLIRGGSIPSTPTKTETRKDSSRLSPNSEVPLWRGEWISVFFDLWQTRLECTRFLPGMMWGRYPRDRPGEVRVQFPSTV